MKCPKCHFENPEDSNFCLKCGCKLELQCPQCASALPSIAEFCNKCGYKLNLTSEAPSKDVSFDEKLTKIQRYHAEKNKSSVLRVDHRQIKR